MKMDGISSKQAQWVFWYTSEFLTSFTFFLSFYLYIFKLLCISFPPPLTTFHSGTYWVACLVDISQLDTLIYFVYVQKSIIIEASVCI